MATTKKTALHPADELGALRAQMAPLREREEQLEKQLKKRGNGAYNGVLWRATVSVYDAKVVGWKAIAEKLNPSPQLLAAHTSKITKTKVCVVALATDKRAA